MPSSALADLALPLGYNGDTRLGQGKVKNDNSDLDIDAPAPDTGD